MDGSDIVPVKLHSAVGSISDCMEIDRKKILIDILPTSVDSRRAFSHLSVSDESVFAKYWLAGPRSLVDRRVDSKSTRFLTAVVRALLGSRGKAKFCLRMVRWFLPGFSGFPPSLRNNRLDISEIFLKGP